ncbi:MAG: EthD family reductase [Ktedonobacteraceae bacterium]|nr:EthD family reductase [Ktedonobacteraceae bacterium]
MVKFLILWDTPTDPVAFERHYREIHIPLAKQLPGLRRYTAGRHATAIRGEPYYWIAELEWDTMDARQKASQSPQGQAVSQDVANLARYAQVRSMLYEVEEL